MRDTIERKIDLEASRADVWHALTDYVAFGEWFNARFQEPFFAGKIARGHITYPGYEYIQIELFIETIEPQHLFKFKWHPYAIDMTKDYSTEPYTIVEVRLEDADKGTVLFLKESGFDHLPENRRLEAYQMNSDGWDEQMKNIRAHIER